MTTNHEKESLRTRWSRAYVDGYLSAAENGPRHSGWFAAGFAALLFAIFLIIGIASGNAQGAAVFGVVFTAYWLPVLIAWGRRVRNPGQVVVLNVFGFLVITWFVALVMAFGTRQKVS